MKIGVIKRVLEVPSTDPEDARRRKLLNILLLGVTALTLLMLVAMVIASIILGNSEGMGDIYFVIPPLLIGLLVIFLVNRYGSGWVASSIFLLLVTVAIAFSDAPRHVVEGRSLFLMTIPILMASVILRPWASFIMAGMVGIIIALLAIYALNGVPPLPTMLSLFAFALISWLSARSLENALHELRLINVELDQRVEDRTRELAEANQELADANERLKELDRLKSRFVSMVSHELRTPLNAIQGFAEMLVIGIYGDLSEKQSNALGRIITNTDRLLKIVNDLLDQARIEAGQIELKIAAFTPTELAENLDSTIRVLAESKDLTFTTEVSEDMPQALHGDLHRIHQVLVNLANNAIKYTEQGGIHAKLYRLDDDRWAADVTDTGPGIREDALAYIFEPFRQVDGSETRTHKGVGLGLSIVQQLTQLMGGEIKVTSEVGKGSTFTVMLPCTPPEKAAHPDKTY